MTVQGRRRALVDLTTDHAAWSIPSHCVDAIGKAFGTGWETREIRSPRPSAADAPRQVSRDTSAYEGVEVYFGWGIPREMIAMASGTLKWAHSGAAGVGASITDELVSSGAVFTNSRGIHAEPISDWVVAAIGYCIRGFHKAVAAQREHRWERSRFTAAEARLTEFSSLRVGIVGLGGIGLMVARKCHALGMEIRGVRREPGRNTPREVAWVGGPGDIHELAENSDVLVLSVPHTRITANLIDESVLRALPRGAYLLNVSRGGIIDEDALLECIECGHVGGCVLDVFSSEPLDPSHRFWDNPKVLVTPHVSAVTDRFWERELELIVENIERYLRGSRLKNVVNVEVGY